MASSIQKKLKKKYAKKPRVEKEAKNKKQAVIESNKARIGYKFSEEAKKKMSESAKRRGISAEHRRKLNECNKNRKHSIETKRKISEAHKGDKHYNWKGGTNPLSILIRHSFEYRQWRSDVFTRDKFTCQECGDNKGGNLEAHHIKSFSSILEEYNITAIEQAINCEELWNINNGITLCEICHRKQGGQ